MSKICQICSKKAMSGNSRSHSNISSKRKMSVNLQTKKIDGQKMTVCTSCIKTINKKKKQQTV